jgi:nucleoside 2-deoxyribosyltransferase
MRPLKVYTASKLREGPRWRKLAEEWSDIDFVARWPFIHVTSDGEAGWPGDCAAHGAEFWRQDHEDVARCDVVLVYSEANDILKGALVEAGMALAMGKVVIVVGDNPGYGTWQFHQQVRRVATLEAARSLLRLMAGHPSSQADSFKPRAHNFGVPAAIGIPYKAPKPMTETELNHYIGKAKS